MDSPSHHHHIIITFEALASSSHSRGLDLLAAKTRLMHSAQKSCTQCMQLLTTLPRSSAHTGSWARPTPQHLVTHSLGLSWRAVTPKDSSRSSWSGPVSNLPLSSTSTYDAPQTNEASLNKGVLGLLGSSRGSRGRRQTVPAVPMRAQGGALEGVLSDAPHGEAPVEMWRAPVCKRGLLHEINGRVPRDLDCK